MTVTLAQLLEESPKLEVARRDESVGVVMERMIEHDYSQLPVVDDGAPLRAIGLISTGTIARAAFTLGIAPGELRVQHAIDEHPVKKRLRDELWRSLDDVRNGEVLLVEDDAGVLRGILTGQDFSSFLRQQSEDSLTVLDIEHTIKQLILDHYGDDEDKLREAVRRELGVHHRSLKKDVRKIVATYLKQSSNPSSNIDQAVFDDSFDKHRPDTNSYEFDRLSFNQYQQIFVSAECWASYADEIGLPVKSLDALLTIARNLRNQMMHNRGLPTPAERDKLIYCRALLSRIADRRNQLADPARVETSVSEPPPVATVEAPPSVSVASETPDEDEDDELGPLTLVSAHFGSVADHEDRVTWTFNDLDRLTNNSLPVAAREHRSWWTNDEEAPQSAIWRDAGWRVVSVNMTTGTVTFGRNTEREERLLDIFGVLTRRLSDAPGWSHPKPTLGGRTWQTLTRFSPDEGNGAQLVWSFVKRERFRIELYIDTGDRATNKASFDALAQHRDALEQAIGAPLTWERIPHRRASRVALYYPREVSVRSSDEAIEALAKWAVQYVPKFHAAMREHYRTVPAR